MVNKPFSVPSRLNILSVDWVRHLRRPSLLCDLVVSDGESTCGLRLSSGMLLHGVLRARILEPLVHSELRGSGTLLLVRSLTIGWGVAGSRALSFTSELLLAWVSSWSWSCSDHIILRLAATSLVHLVGFKGSRQRWVIFWWGHRQVVDRVPIFLTDGHTCVVYG